MKHANKRIFHFSLILLLASCSDTMDPNFTVSSDFLRVSNVALGGNATSVTLHIDADCSWEITEEVDWLSVSPVQGRGSADVTLTTGVNPSAIDERSCQLFVTSDDGVRRPVTLRQSKADESLSVSTAKLEFDETGGTSSFTITSNTRWTVSGGAEWLSYSPKEGTDNGSISIAVQTNTAEFSREAVLTVTSAGGSQPQTITITQAEKTVTLTIEPAVINAMAVADDYTFKIEGNATWKVTADDNTWLTYTPSEGTGPATVTVIISDNNGASDRATSLHVTSASGKYNLPCSITQAAATLPDVTAVEVSGLGRYVATFGSSFTSPLEVSEYGFLWSTTTGSTLDTPGISIVRMGDDGLSFSSTGTSGKHQVLTAGSLSTTVTSLSSGVKYYVRAYARNALGIGYSPDVPFETTGNIPGDDDNPTPNI